MSTPAPDPVARLVDAELEAAVARQRLAATLAKLQIRLNPKTLARQAMIDVTDKGGAAVQAGIETTRRNPAAVAGVAALAGALLARRRILRLFSRRTRDETAGSPNR